MQPPSSLNAWTWYESRYVDGDITDVITYIGFLEREQYSGKVIMSTK